MSWLLTVVSRELHSSDKIGRQGKKDQRPSSNSGPTLYRGVSATRAIDLRDCPLSCEVLYLLQDSYTSITSTQHARQRELYMRMLVTACPHHGDIISAEHVDHKYKAKVHVASTNARTDQCNALSWTFFLRVYLYTSHAADYILPTPRKV